MRRPAQQHHTAPATAWAHPYAGIARLAVFYNDGGAPTPPVPTPAAAPGPKLDDSAPKPKPPAPSSALPGLADGEVVVHRNWLEQKLTAEKDSGRRNGNQRLASDLGFDDVNGLRTYVEEQKKAEQARMSEHERKEKELTDREARAAAREKAAEARERAAAHRAVLVGLGATGTDLEDAVTLLRVPDDADDQALTDAATQLKERRPELFGIKPPAAPPQLPPAPGGAPAGGPPVRQAPTGKPGDRGRAIAQARGHRPAA
ncbi:hypothetical protein [Streptomyces sp. NRRL F-5135]|uniref:hypothetical protein n=1 Tax=Streptomyces sp. NRRL F-5135 TaxID=1463858 RepID=UPI0004CBF6FF|nr:hypothetical protein [Streptomyces sp. NRRL F-5135]